MLKQSYITLTQNKSFICAQLFLYAPKTREYNKKNEEIEIISLFLRRNMKKTLGALLCLISMSFCVVGCSDKDQSLQKVLDANELVLGLDASFPPMGYLNDAGNIAGFDIDVAEAVCKRLNINLKTQPINWDEKEKELNEGRIDCIWNGMSVTPARQESMNLSDPYMKNELILLVTGTNPARSVKDIGGMTVGVQSGSSAQEALHAADFYQNIIEKPYEDNMTLIQQLESGEVKVALLDSVAAYFYIYYRETKFFVLSETLGEEEYAIGFRKGDQKLRDKVQEILSDMKADGSLGKISKNWFGSDITIVK